jgi:hypothetical protein
MHGLAGGEKIPGGDEKRIPGGVGILFLMEGKDPRRAAKNSFRHQRGTA